MPRPKYSRSDETYDVLRRHIQPISKEYGCDDSYIYAIKNGDTNDPYPHFRRLFSAAARAGAPVRVWLDDLSGVAVAAASGSSCIDKLSEQLVQKININAEATTTIISALSDKQLEKHECHTVLAALALEAENIKKLEHLVQRKLAELGTKIPTLE